MEQLDTPHVASELTPWDRVQRARHPQRPHTLDYVFALCEDFVELHGDRRFGDDAAIVGGMASFNGRTVMVLGHQKGSDTRENMRRNFGMPLPEGYRKAQRLMRHAEKFGIPVLCFVDTPGANPNKESEERGQGNAIAEGIQVMTTLRTPIIATVIGEGGSGGALAISVGDRILMQENSIYSVASPEAAASILWRDSARAPDASRALKLTAQDLLELEIIDEIITEPAGGAHLDAQAAINAAGERIAVHLEQVCALDLDTLLHERYAKYRSIGRFEEQQNVLLRV
ncbi:acetyl-CoA carboxylase carboxyltransferase subunit alpha [Candidatus Viridilinea mediisalina]|uniref:Acetyl-coenzyme A carboxylase carboxyl transferase subunit alpha n=1 Tax=Candidatus Viridilinea mediisalina TaxID=2024553 RepID=A0A2A6RPC4_9CHLR|nr:acetyl-CoA carboxylase carboxyltransferase subunit alpha [Candidatus Viridilinea mediisalina]PDW04719.1 acetyl-CoA carboxylase carboxyl transferase subunit alpha [Candidatus Viridilinea mediisalina]